LSSFDVSGAGSGDPSTNCQLIWKTPTSVDWVVARRTEAKQEKSARLNAVPNDDPSTKRKKETQRTHRKVLKQRLTEIQIPKPTTRTLIHNRRPRRFPTIPNLDLLETIWTRVTSSVLRRVERDDVVGWGGGLAACAETDGVVGRAA
jgi:hypothetical protein